MFVWALKSVPLEIIGWFFSLDPDNFSATDKPRVEFPGVPNVKKKLKTHLFKLAKNGNKAKRKSHKFFFDFLKIKFVPTNSELNSASGNQAAFFLKSRCGT